MGNPRKPAPAGGTPAPVDTAPPAPPATPPADTPPPAPPAPPAADDFADDAEAPVRARVLMAFDDHRPDEIVTGTADEIEALRVTGLVDPHPDAVAFAEGLAA